MSDSNCSNEARPLRNLWQTIRSGLSDHGVFIGVKDLGDLEDFDLADLGNLHVDFGSGRCGIKVCVSSDLKSSAEEMKGTQRDQVIMVRVDEETRDKLDDWVRTGAVKSRSESAALFIREGLKVREDELERLRDGLGEVEAAKERVQQKAREVFEGGQGAEEN